MESALHATAISLVSLAFEAPNTEAKTCEAIYFPPTKKDAVW